MVTWCVIVEICQNLCQHGISNVFRSSTFFLVSFAKYEGARHALNFLFNLLLPWLSSFTFLKFRYSFLLFIPLLVTNVISRRPGKCGLLNVTLPRYFPSRKIARKLPPPEVVLPPHLHTDSLYGRTNRRTLTS